MSHLLVSEAQIALTEARQRLTELVAIRVELGFTPRQQAEYERLLDLEAALLRRRDSPAASL